MLVTFDLPAGVSGEQTVEISLAAGGNTFTDSAFVTLTGSTSAAAAPQDRRAREPLIDRTGFMLGALAFGLGLAGVLAFALGGGSPSR